MVEYSSKPVSRIKSIRLVQGASAHVSHPNLSNRLLGQLHAPNTLQESMPARARATADFERQVERERGRGASLDGSILQELEHDSQTDLSNVVVHTDNESARLAAQLGADAFSTGDDIFFAQDVYDPVSSPSRALIRHEIGHVLQYRRGESRAASESDQNYRRLESSSESGIAQSAPSAYSHSASGDPIQCGALRSAVEDVKWAAGEGWKLGEGLGEWVFGDPNENIAKLLGEPVPGKLEEAPEPGSYIPGPTSGSSWFDEVISGDMWGLL